MQSLDCLCRNAPERRPGQVTVVAVVKNERDILPAFLRHYRSLGVERFLLIDNDSDDGSRDYLRAQPDIDLYATDESYAASYAGLLWINALCAEHCVDGWTLVVDADEFLILPDGARSLPDFTAEMRRDLDLGLYCPLVDLVSPRANEETIGTFESFEDLIADQPRFEPFDDAMLRDLGSYPFVEIRTGLRETLSGKSGYGPRVSKIPLVYWRPGFRFHKSTHECAEIPLSLRVGVLAHFKFRAGFAARVAHERATYDRYNTDHRTIYGQPLDLSGIGDLPVLRCDGDFSAAGWLAEGNPEPHSLPALWQAKNITRGAAFDVLAGDTAGGSDALAERYLERATHRFGFAQTLPLRRFLFARRLIPPDHVPEIVRHPAGPVESLTALYESFWWTMAAILRLPIALYEAVRWRSLPAGPVRHRNPSSASPQTRHQGANRSPDSEGAN